MIDTGRVTLISSKDDGAGIDAAWSPADNVAS